jgi:hypothetical protein
MLKMGGSRTQKIAHRFVLDDITGLGKARAQAVRLTRFGVGVSAIGAIVILTAGSVASVPFGGAVRLSLGLMLASLPFAAVALTYTTRISLLRNNLRLKRFMIGRRHYSLDDNRTIIRNEENQPVDAEVMRELSLFNIAGSLAYDEPALVPASGASAWEWFGTFAELPGIAIGFSRFGVGGRTYAFVYGQPKTVLEHTVDIWDMGHVRKISSTDKSEVKKTAQTWNKSGGASIALAYAPLPADIDVVSITPELLAKDLTLLGLAQLHGTREYGHSFPIDPAEAILTTTRSSLSSTLAITLLGVVSYLGYVLFSIPPAVGLAQIAILKLAAEVLPAASLAWDHVRPGKKLKATHLVRQAAEAGLLMGSLAYTNYLFYFSRHSLGITTIAPGSIAHYGATALALLSLGFCLLIDIIMHRAKGKTLTRYQLYNPLFLLGCASAVLALLAGAYAIGPLAADDLWFGGVAAALYIAVRKLQLYANTHHTRDHILELLKEI